MSLNFLFQIKKKKDGFWQAAILNPVPVFGSKHGM